MKKVTDVAYTQTKGRKFKYVGAIDFDTTSRGLAWNLVFNDLEGIVIQIENYRDDEEV